jgi:hypothetical protein
MAAWNDSTALVQARGGALQLAAFWASVLSHR